MTTGTGLLLVAGTLVIAVLIVATAVYRDIRRSPHRSSGDPPSPVVRAAGLFILLTVSNAAWFGVVRLLQAVIGPF